MFTGLAGHSFGSNSCPHTFELCLPADAVDANSVPRGGAGEAEASTTARALSGQYMHSPKTRKIIATTKRRLVCTSTGAAVSLLWIGAFLRFWLLSPFRPFNRPVFESLRR